MSKQDSTCAPRNIPRQPNRRGWTVHNDSSFLSDFRSEPGCYVVIASGVVQYVGSSNNVRRRMDAHGTFRWLHGAGVETPWGIFTSVHFIIKVRYSTKYGDWAMRELRLIRRLRPLLNVTHNNTKDGQRRV